MTNHPQLPTHAYAVTIDFHSADDCYAREIYSIDAIDAMDAERLGRIEAEQSVYYDVRIPDLNLLVGVAEIEPPEPDGDPSAPASTRARATCPGCGSEDIVKDASARWDEDEQCWSLSGTYDNETCQSCGAEGDEFVAWVNLERPLGPGARVRVRRRERIGGDRFAGREGEVLKTSPFGLYVRLDVRPRERVQKIMLFEKHELDRIPEAGLAG